MPGLKCETFNWLILAEGVQIRDRPPFCFVWDRDWNLLCRLGWLRIHRDPPASAYRELRLKLCTSRPSSDKPILKQWRWWCRLNIHMGRSYSHDSYTLYSYMLYCMTDAGSFSWLLYCYIDELQWTNLSGSIELPTLTMDIWLDLVNGASGAW